MVPLSRLPELADAAQVWVVEGEKCVEAMRKLGLTATTSTDGAKSARQTNWTPLAGKKVVVLPNNDEAGRAYAGTVTEILHLLIPPARVKILDRGLPEGADIADYVEATAHTEPDKLAKVGPALAQLAERSPEVPVHDLLVVTLSDVEPEEVEFIWPGRIPRGKLTMCVGDPGVGKSFLSTDVAARVTRGERWPDSDQNAPQGDVVILSAEDGVADTIRPRCEAAGADLARVHVVTAVCACGDNKERHFDLTQDLQRLRYLVDRKRAILVVIDPLSAYLGETNTHRDATVRAVLAPVARMAAETGVAVLAVAHLNKNSATRSVYRTGGSIAFTASARSVLAVGFDPDERDKQRRVMVPVKFNLGKPAPGIGFSITGCRVVYDGRPVEVDSDTLLGDPTPGGQGDSSKPAREEAQEFLKAVLSEGPRAAAEVLGEAKKAGLTESTMRRAAKELGVAKRKKGNVGDAGWWEWSLPANEG